MSTQREKIIKKVYEILENKPNGIRYADLIREIKNALPETNIKTIHGNIYYLRHKIENEDIKDILRPEKGLYVLKKYFKEGEISSERGIELSGKRIEEKYFYKPFADYLVNELEECTKAIPLGGNKFQDRWGTPDVIGTYKVLGIGHIQPPIEIISAEIKSDIGQLLHLLVKLVLISFLATKFIWLFQKMLMARI